MLSPLTYNEFPGIEWEKLDFESGKNLFDITDSLELDYEYLFGSFVPGYSLSRKSALIEGSAYFSHLPENENKAIFVIDGDLTVTGSLILRNLDIYTPLWVRGSLTVDDLVLDNDVVLVVDGNLTVRNVLVTDLTDAGCLTVLGNCSINDGAMLAAPSGFITPEKIFASLKPKSSLHENSRSFNDVVEHLLAKKSIFS